MTTEEILLITNGLSAIAGLWFWRRSDTYKKEAEDFKSRLVITSNGFEELKIESDKLYLDKIQSDEMDRFYKDLLQKNAEEFNSHRTESSAIINQSAENNAKLVAEIETLKSDKQKLFERVQELKRDKRILHSMAKGATAKLAEMNVATEELMLANGVDIKLEEDIQSFVEMKDDFINKKQEEISASINNNIRERRAFFEIGDYVRGNVFHFEMHEREGFVFKIEPNSNLLVVKTKEGDLIELRVSTCKVVLNPELGIDWNVPQPFPENYQVPPLTKVVMIESNHPIVDKGCKGIVREKNYSAIPYTRVDWDYGKTLSAYSHQLAPLNPLDHPNHPDFRG